MAPCACRVSSEVSNCKIARIGKRGRRGLLINFPVWLLCVFLWNAVLANAQDVAGMEQGLKPYGSFDGGSIDSISMVNLKPNVHIPLLDYPQRGGKLNLGFYISYQNPIYEARTVNCLTVKPFTCTFQYFMYRPPAIQIIPNFAPIGWCSVSCGNLPNGGQF